MTCKKLLLTNKDLLYSNVFLFCFFLGPTNPKIPPTPPHTQAILIVTSFSSSRAAEEDSS